MDHGAERSGQGCNIAVSVTASLQQRVNLPGTWYAQQQLILKGQLAVADRLGGGGGGGQQLGSLIEQAWSIVTAPVMRRVCTPPNGRVLADDSKVLVWRLGRERQLSIQV